MKDYVAGTGSIADGVIAILARHSMTEPQTITAEMPLEALGLDSLGMVEAIFSVEEFFDISVPFSPGAEPTDDAGLPMGNLSRPTVGSLIDSVRNLVMGRAE